MSFCIYLRSVELLRKEEMLDVLSDRPDFGGGEKVGLRLRQILNDREGLLARGAILCECPTAFFVRRKRRRGQAVDQTGNRTIDSDSQGGRGKEVTHTWIDLCLIDLWLLHPCRDTETDLQWSVVPGARLASWLVRAAFQRMQA